MEVTFDNIDLSKLDLVAEALLPMLSVKTAVLIHGEMGAGKTTFVQALLQHMGIQETKGSPTFAIIEAYDSDAFQKIYHIDAYRLNSDEEAASVGLDELFEENALFLIEWPEKISKFLPDRCIHLEIQPIDAFNRTFTLTHDN